MNYITLPDFVNDAENIINDTIINESFTTVKTTEGNAVLISEQQYSCLLDALIRKTTIDTLREPPLCQNK